MTARLLMLCPYWPPMGGPGVQRGVKFAKYLPAFGVEPYVITRKADAVEDESLVAEAAPVRVRATAHLPFQRLGRRQGGAAQAGAVGRMKRVRDWLQVPDHVLSWAPFAMREARAWHREIKADALYSTSPYHSTHLAALALKKRLGIPWIADFRDPWATDRFTNYPTALHRRLNAAQERAVVRAADAVVVISQAMRADFAARYPDQAHKLEVIYNGYDESDFTALPPAPPGPPWVIRHLGTFYPDRRPDSFLEGLAALRGHDPARAGRVRVEFYGRHHLDVEARLKALTASLGLDDLVRFFPYVSHHEALKLLGTSHGLLLVPGPGAGTVTGKIFEYLAARRPILAVAPFPSGIDEVVKLPLRAADRAEAVTPVLTRWLDAWEHGDPGPVLTDAATAASFSRRAAAEQLAALTVKLRAGAASL